MMESGTEDGLYLALFSVHGLVRGTDMELGRDADTGGQVKYVVELARKAAADPRVGRVDLFTRLVEDPKVDAGYAEPIERLCEGAQIVRLRCGPRRYLRKEVLWPHLDSLVDESLRHFRRIGRIPDILHSHYADAGYVVTQLAGCLGVRHVHTGHSLGRVKRQRLVDKGVSPDSIEKQFNITQRIEAEELALDSADIVVASTSQEVDEQYALYESYEPRRMVVIPPGVDLQRFRPTRRGDETPPIQKEIDRFLAEPARPLIVALSRPDTRKNIATLVEAYAGSSWLRERANLLVVAGSRDDIAEMNREPREVLTDLLLRFDRHDLYGRVAYPKRHEPSEVPAIYRIAARRKGVFVNPALTEPFGLTLLEAAASGLPIVATDDGGPREILARTESGFLVDALDADAMAAAIEKVLRDPVEWRRLSLSGQRGVRRHFSWQAHVKNYLRTVRRMTRRSRGRQLVVKPDDRLTLAQRLLITDIDNTLIGDREAVAALLEQLRPAARYVGFGIATGRRIESTLSVLRRWKVPRPNVLISSVGTEIHYGSTLVADRGWARHIAYRWQPLRVRLVLDRLPGLRLQPQTEQRRFKISYFHDPEKAPSIAEIRRLLREAGLAVKVIHSHESFLDILPVRASKGGAVRYVATRWGIPMDAVLTAGDSGNDEEMLSGETLAVVVGNHADELAKLEGRENVYFAEGTHAWGIIEGLEHYAFLTQPDPQRVLVDAR